MKQSLGEFICTLRKAQGYTQAEVAQMLNVSNRTLSSWETDRTAPDVAVLPALADIYGVTVDEILRCERQPKNTDENKLSQAAEAAMRKNRFAKFCGKRILCFGLGLLGAAVFVAMCAVLLYSSAPLWLSILLMVLGAGGNAACIILLSYFYYSTLRQEGIIFDYDCTEEKKAYALTLRHGFSSAFILNSLPYILGAIVYLTVYFAAGYDDYSVTVGNTSIRIDYTTPTVVLVVFNLLVGITMLVFGYSYDRAGIKKLGTENQIKTVKYNAKLLLKLCGFGTIPICLILILFIVLSSINVESVYEIYFTAHSVDEVYQNFQTLTIDEEYSNGHSAGIDENGEEIINRVTYPKGKYFLNFQSETYYELTGYEEYVKFYDLGNGFYGEPLRYDIVFSGPEVYGWEVYRIFDGKSIEDATKDDSWEKFLSYYTRYDSVPFKFAGETYYTVGVSRNNLYYTHDWNENGISNYKFDVKGTYYEKENEYRLELICYDNYAPLSCWLWLGVSGATVITCTVIWFVKRKKNEYKF